MISYLRIVAEKSSDGKVPSFQAGAYVNEDWGEYVALMEAWGRIWARVETSGELEIEFAKERGD